MKQKLPKDSGKAASFLRTIAKRPFNTMINVIALLLNDGGR